VLVHRDGTERIMCDWCYDVGPTVENMLNAGWVSFQARRGGTMAPADNCPKCRVPYPKAKPVRVAQEIRPKAEVAA
jgi:hypothetical protein